MSGHSHWAGIKHHKGINDAKRAAIFTKAGRNIILAAERGGSNPDTNYALKIAIDAARAVNMPKDKIERAIKRGTGELVGEKIETVTYEGFGPGQIALLIETITNNKNRTVSELKSLFTKGGGKFGTPGSVAFLFKRVGLITFPLEKYPTDSLEAEVFESGADDFFVAPESLVVVTAVEQLQTVEEYFRGKSILCESAELGYLPTQTVSLPENAMADFEVLLEALDDHPDVHKVWDNANTGALGRK